MRNESGTKNKTYCVTGSTGYIGSWLVKSLLERGYEVNATLRNPDKASHFRNLWRGGGERLSLFKADLNEDGSFDDAVRGCDGVFHVAASMEFEVPPEQNFDYVKTEIINPAIKGTLNVLKACLKSNTVKRVIFTSSISTLTAKDSSGKYLPVVDESCQTIVDRVIETKASGWVYVLSKLLTEEAAFEFAKNNGVDLVSVITTTVGGPFLTPTVPSSIRVLLSPITGDPKLLKILSAVNSRMGSIALVHIEDLCNAHIYLMEHESSHGQYICCAGSCVMSEIVELLKRQHNCCIEPRLVGSDHGSFSVPTDISSNKIRELGFKFDCSVEDVVHQSVQKCVDFGFLSPLDSKSSE